MFYVKWISIKLGEKTRVIVAFFLGLWGCWGRSLEDVTPGDPQAGPRHSESPHTACSVLGMYILPTVSTVGAISRAQP